MQRGAAAFREAWSIATKMAAELAAETAVEMADTNSWAGEIAVEMAASGTALRALECGIGLAIGNIYTYY